MRILILATLTHFGKILSHLARILLRHLLTQRLYSQDWHDSYLLTTPNDCASLGNLMQPLSLKEAAAMARVHPDTLRRAIKRKALPDRRIQGCQRYWLLPTDLFSSVQPSDKAA